MQTLLAIDDDINGLDLLSGIISKLMPDCNVITAQSGREGIELARSESPDAILLDIAMPDMDGWKTCRRLMSEESTKNIPIIMVTLPETDNPSRGKGLECGATAFLAKPFDPFELVSQVQLAMRLKKAEENQWAQKNSLEIAIEDIPAELLQSEEYHGDLFSNMIEAFAYCRVLFEGGCPKDFVYLKVNHAFEALTGLRDVVGRKASEVLPGVRKNDPALFEIVDRVVLTGKPEKSELYLKTMKAWYSISTYRPQKGHFVALFDDISARKEAEKSIQEGSALLKSIVEGTTDVVYAKDPAGRYILFNTAAGRAVGKDTDDVLGRTDYTIFPPAEAHTAHYQGRRSPDSRGGISQNLRRICDECRRQKANLFIDQGPPP